MSFNSPQFITINPNYTEPGLLMPYSQKSGAFSLLASGNPSVKLSEGDLQVYVKSLQLRTQVAGGQSAFTEIPSCSIEVSYGSTPTYMLRAQAEYDHHDIAAASVWDVPLLDAERLGCRQAIFQQLRSMLLYGMNAAGGEGVLNTAGATAVTLPPDTNGNTTLLQYDNGQMALFLLQQIVNIQTAALQGGIPSKVVIVAPQRVLLYMMQVAIVQLLSYQSPGGGVQTTAGLVKEISDQWDNEIMYAMDDTLIGKGAGGSDMVIMTIPELKVPVGSEPNTNEFAKLKPGILGNNMQYCDMAAPREIYSGTMPQGFVHTTYELRATSAWCFRPELLELISIPFTT